MPTFTFRVVRRAADGCLGPTLYERSIEALDEFVAVSIARAIDLDMAALGANAIYLTNLDGRAIWSLHLDSPRNGADI